jgi:hypothetical protein
MGAFYGSFHVRTHDVVLVKDAVAASAAIGHRNRRLVDERVLLRPRLFRGCERGRARADGGASGGIRGVAGRRGGDRSPRGNPALWRAEPLENGLAVPGTVHVMTVSARGTYIAVGKRLAAAGSPSSMRSMTGGACAIRRRSAPDAVLGPRWLRSRTGPGHGCRANPRRGTGAAGTLAARAVTRRQIRRHPRHAEPARPQQATPFRARYMGPSASSWSDARRWRWGHERRHGTMF